MQDEDGLADLPGEPIELQLFKPDDVPMLLQELCRFYHKPDLVKIRDAAQIIIMNQEFDANKVELMAKMVEGQPVP